MYNLFRSLFQQVRSSLDESNNKGFILHSLLLYTSRNASQKPIDIECSQYFKPKAASRRRMSEARFNKLLQSQCLFKPVRIRRQALARLVLPNNPFLHSYKNYQVDSILSLVSICNRIAGSWNFSGIRWLNPLDPKHRLLTSFSARSRPSRIASTARPSCKPCSTSPRRGGGTPPHLEAPTHASRWLTRARTQRRRYGSSRRARPVLLPIFFETSFLVTFDLTFPLIRPFENSARQNKQTPWWAALAQQAQRRTCCTNRPV